MLAVRCRAARHPRRTFVRTTVALTLLSLLPDVLADAGASTRPTLALTHIVAAAIVIPRLARRLSDYTQPTPGILPVPPKGSDQ